MSEVWDWPFRKVVEVSASSSPTPGGGSVSALVASLGVAMVAMVGNLTVGKEKFKDVEPEVKSILDDCYRIIGKLEELVDRDIAEFGNFMQVMKMPKNTEEEKALRNEKMQEALKRATDVPLETARTCLEALKLAERISEIGNPGAISDAGVGAYVTEAALNAVLLNVDINVPSIKDKDYCARAVEEKEKLMEEAKAIKEKAIGTVTRRLSQ